MTWINIDTIAKAYDALMGLPSKFSYDDMMEAFVKVDLIKDVGLAIVWGEDWIEWLDPKNPDNIREIRFAKVSDKFNNHHDEVMKTVHRYGGIA